MIKNQRVVAIIPARGGSKGVPRKNLRTYQNRSLLAHTISTARASQYIDAVVVSSEDPEILHEAKQQGAEVPFIRPSTLAEDSSPAIDCVLHALDHLPLYDYVILLQVTSPLRTTADIDNCLDYCMQQQAASCVSVTASSQHPFWMYTLNEQQQLTPLFSDSTPTRRQDLPPIYVLNGAIYLANTDWLRKNKAFVTQETLAFQMPEERSLDIDEEFDFCILNAYSAALPK